MLALIWLAGLVQVAIAAANCFLPKKPKYRENLKRVSPIVRQVFLVHAGYVVGVLLLFAAVNFEFSSDLNSGRSLGRFLAGAMALFWLCRVPLQVCYYDASVRHANRVADVGFITATVFPSFPDGATAIGPSL